MTPPGIPLPPFVAPENILTVLDEHGEVLRVVSFADDEQRAANTPATGSVVLGKPPSMSHYRSAGAWVTKAPRPSDSHRWNPVTKAWADPRTVADIVAQANTAIEGAAGAARLRYISDGPGQGAAYLRKADQAAAYARSNFNGLVPKYIEAEAAARGMTAEAVAREIITMADLWEEQIGPAIEARRVAGKKAVAAAADRASALAQLQIALAALAAL